MADGITDEMWRAAAHAVTEARRTDAIHNDYELAEQVLKAALAGRTVVDLPEPESQRERLTGVMHVWPIGGWSVAAEPDRINIATSRDGFGGGMGFSPERARLFAAAMLAAADVAEQSPTDVAGGVL